MEEMGISGSSYLLDVPKSAHLRQEISPDDIAIDNARDTSCGNIVIVENSHHNRSAPSSVIIPLNNQTPGNILPLSNKLKISHKSMKAMPKITFNANNLQKFQKAKLQNNITSDLDDDLGNILDIPIIFAKDDDNLNSIDKMPVVTHAVPSKELNERPKLNNTKIVLISNKQDKLQQTSNKSGIASAQAVICPNIPMQNLNRLLLQTRSQNIGVPAKTRIGVPMDKRLVQPTVKYTKIILAKRKTQPILHNESNGQIITAKTSEDMPKNIIFEEGKRGYVQAQTCKPEINYENPFPDNALEIEDAIKTNIIERNEYTSALAPLDNEPNIPNETKHADPATFDDASEMQV